MAAEVLSGIRFAPFSAYTGEVSVSSCVVATLLVVVACVLYARRTRASSWKLLGLVLPVLLIVEVTLFRWDGGVTFSLAGAFRWSPDGWRRISYNPGSDQVVLNVLLFVPAGFAWTLARRRPFAVWLGLTGLSLLIELIQGATGLGAADVARVAAVSRAGGVGEGVPDRRPPAVLAGRPLDLVRRGGEAPREVSREGLGQADRIGLEDRRAHRCIVGVRTTASSGRSVRRAPTLAVAGSWLESATRHGAAAGGSSISPVR